MGATSRAGTAADAILGVVPRLVYSPSTQEEASAALALCAREQLAVSFAGGRTDIGLGAVPRRLDALIETGRLNRIIEYAPSDMVLVAEAGVTLAAVQALVGAERQQLSLDPPLPERATLGGIIAANSFGPRRARYGSVRDLIIGVSLIRADGVVAHGGGKVVKNVAGFDLPKMACGSLGTLALIGTASFRLHPLPEAYATVLISRLSPGAIAALVARMAEAQLEPGSAVALREADAGPLDLAVRFEGFAAGVSQQAARLRELAGTDASAPLDAGAARQIWERHDAARTRGGLRLKLVVPPSRFERLEPEALLPLCAALRTPLLAWYATLGIGFVSGEVNDASAAVAAIDRARTAAVALGGSLTVVDAPREVRALVDPWGPPPPAFALMRRLKDRFDAGHRLNPGRFVGGL